MFGFAEAMCHGSEADEGAAAELEIAFGLEGRWRRWFSTSLVEKFPVITRVVPWHGPWVQLLVR